MMSAGCPLTSRTVSDVSVYELITVDGDTLPFRSFEDRDGYQELVSSTLSFRGDSTAELVSRLRNKLPNGFFPQTDSVTGTYMEIARGIQLFLPDLPTVSLIRDSAGLTLSTESHVYLFKRKT